MVSNDNRSQCPAFPGDCQPFSWNRLDVLNILRNIWKSRAMPYANDPDRLSLDVIEKAIRGYHEFTVR
jgi:hypothetical protein